MVERRGHPIIMDPLGMVNFSGYDYLLAIFTTAVFLVLMLYAAKGSFFGFDTPPTETFDPEIIYGTVDEPWVTEDYSLSPVDRPLQVNPAPLPPKLKEVAKNSWGGEQQIMVSDSVYEEAMRSFQVELKLVKAHCEDELSGRLILIDVSPKTTWNSSLSNEFNRYSISQRVDCSF